MIAVQFSGFQSVDDDAATVGNEDAPTFDKYGLCSAESARKVILLLPNVLIKSRYRGRLWLVNFNWKVAFPGVTFHSAI